MALITRIGVAKFRRLTSDWQAILNFNLVTPEAILNSNPVSPDVFLRFLGDHEGKHYERVHGPVPSREKGQLNGR